VSVTRRTSERHPRRIEVRFWRRGSLQPHSGFTIDLSRSGMFLGTTISLEPGERLRLELVDRELGFLIEGEVARVHRVAQALRHVEQPGVGVRFLQPAELVARLLSTTKARTGSVSAQRIQLHGAARSNPQSAGSTVEGRERDAAAEPVPVPAVVPEPAPAPEAGRSDVDELFDDGPAASPSATAAPPAAPPAAPAAGDRTVAVEFVDRASFLSVYHRDISAGGLFVTTTEPAALQQVVTIELRPPVRTPHPLRFEARVVHRFEPGGGGGTGLTGMGVQFLDPDRVRAALAPILVELRR
jgi:Tfp pilus assembly protein PilZ